MRWLLPPASASPREQLRGWAAGEAGSTGLAWAAAALLLCTIGGSGAAGERGCAVGEATKGVAAAAGCCDGSMSWGAWEATAPQNWNQAVRRRKGGAGGAAGRATGVRCGGGCRPSRGLTGDVRGGAMGVGVMVGGAAKSEGSAREGAGTAVGGAGSAAGDCLRPRAMSALAGLAASGGPAAVPPATGAARGLVPFACCGAARLVGA